MSLDPSLAARVQTSAPGLKIELFDLDVSPVTGSPGKFYFFPATKESNTGGGGALVWKGNTYTPLPMEMDPVEVSSQGTLPRPKIRFSNVMLTITSLIQTYGRVTGMILTRWQTFTDYLDAGATPNPNAYLPTEVFVFDRITSHNKQQVEIECRSYLDFERRKLPARQLLQSVCTHTYRLYNPNTGLFNYANASCPYTGTNYFDVNNNATNIQNDKCSKQISGCHLRFDPGSLPTRALPGLGRYTA